MIGGEPEEVERVASVLAVHARSNSAAQLTHGRRTSDQACSSAEKGYLNYGLMGADNQLQPWLTCAGALQFDKQTRTVQPPAPAEMIHPLSRRVRAESNP